MANQNPEQIARDKIDKMLNLSGWVVQSQKEINWHAAAGIAVREYPTDIGPMDYLLFVDKIPVGIIEAKREEEGERLTIHEDQARNYAKSKRKWLDQDTQLPFFYVSNGVRTIFANLKDPKHRSMDIFSFHRPETLKQWFHTPHSLRARLQHIPALPETGLWQCQITAIQNLEQSFKDNKPRALLQMATGSGKTFTAVTTIYRLLKFAHAKRVLFLVDTRNLGEQAESEFMKFTPTDDNRKFTELYNVQRLKSSYVSTDSQVCISTIQRMYSILRGEELDEHAEENNPHEFQFTGRPVEVEYNSKVPLGFFDFIVIDECHRSIYNTWRQVLDYFDAFLIGLTATPDKRTFGFFNENLVSEYTHERAVADGVNVGYRAWMIETDITKNGGRIAAKEYVDTRERLSRKKRWTQLEDEVVYTGSHLDRSVVNLSQIRNVIREFKAICPTLFPGRQEVPKTLIFAKTDSHADDIIGIVREEFNEGNDFCKKITYTSKEDPKSLLASFRNDYNPRVAVTVDMIATGTDVKPLECLLFMRDVRSRNYFEQMKGRGTRTMSGDDLQRVTPSAQTNKLEFIIVDAVGVCESIKTDSRPLECKPNVSLGDLLKSVLMGADDDATFSSLAGRLVRLDKQITHKEREKVTQLAEGVTLHAMVNQLLDAVNPDKIEEQARQHEQLDKETEPTALQLEQARHQLGLRAVAPFNGPLITYLEKVRSLHEQIMDGINPDTVLKSEWYQQAKDNAAATIQSFKQYMEEHREEIVALSIFYSRPFRARGLTYKMIEELLDSLIQNKPDLAPFYVWTAYQRMEKVAGLLPKSQLVALVSLIRRIVEIDQVLTPFDDMVNRNFQNWAMKKHAGNAPKFSEEQMDWLRMIRDHVATSFHIEASDLDYAPFDAKGGLGKMYQLFVEKIDAVFDEMNDALWNKTTDENVDLEN